MNGGDEWRYMIIHPESAGAGDLWRFWKQGNIESGSNFITSNCCLDDEEGSGRFDFEEWKSMFGEKDKRWVIVVSVIVRKLIRVFGKPLEWFGYFVDFFLNLLTLNGNLFGLFINFVKGKVVIPQRGTASFISSIGHLDGRIDLCKTDNFGGDSDPHIHNKFNFNPALMDLCIMASKLVYENQNVVKQIVVDHWKMHFVGFYNGWNDYQQDMSTQVFILCDKPVDATFILISFRGTEPFDADDWSTDFDYSWYEIPGLGKLHMGFLEALGLGNRTYTLTFQHNLANKSTISSTPDMAQLTAYNAVTTKLQDLLKEHKNAKFVITGHSLGAALAILYPTVLILRDESAMMQRLLCVYTFGQPRIADSDLGRYIDARLNTPDELRYFRVVYCNDVVPRLPYDNNTFLYKHFGVCLYYNSFYSHKEVEEEPNKNFYGIRYLIPAHMNALWELIRAFAMKYVYGAGYEEDWYSIFLRVVGLLLPGISAHSPRDYVNSVRLGNARDYAVQMYSID